MKSIIKHNAHGAKTQTPRMLVIHAMGEFIKVGKPAIHAPDFLAGEKLSAHALVAPDGTVYRCREDTEGAYHAKGFNTDSLGVEILVAGEHDYTSFAKAIKTRYVKPKQYASVVALCKGWVASHGILKIVRHSDLSPGRKIDPGIGFPWEKFLADVNA